MAVNERSFGPFYFARISTSKRRVPAHTGGIVEMAHPWRRGKARIFRTPWTKPSRAVALGIWFRDRSKAEEGFEDDKWLSPHLLANVSADEISSWDRGDDGPTAQGEEQFYRAQL